MKRWPCQMSRIRIAMLVMVGLSLALVSSRTCQAADRLQISLPEGTRWVPTWRMGGSPWVSLSSLAKTLGLSIEGDMRGTVNLLWDGGRVSLHPDRGRVVGPGGAEDLAVMPLRQGADVWVPPEAAAALARARFGSLPVSWDPKTLRLALAPGPALIRAWRTGRHPDRWRLVLETERPVSWSVQRPAEGLLLLVLAHSTVGGGTPSPVPVPGWVRAIDIRQAQGDVQVGLTLADAALRARAFALANPFRVVLDLYPPNPRNGGPSVAPPPTAREAPVAVAARPAVSLIPPGREPLSPRGPAPEGPPPGEGEEPMSPARPAGAPPPPLTIVVDPGHGGKDTGAIGPRGLREKDVVLDISLRLRALLQERLGARVILTRSDDTFVSLEGRTGLAKEVRADFFVSIHVNSAPHPRADGIETYYLSRDASDSEAHASAVRENLVLNLEGIGPREQEGLKAVLWDMAQTLQLQESSALAEMLLEDLGRGLRVGTRGVKHGPFVVLMTSGMPSTLVEVGFLSNPQGERRLQDAAYRQQIAVALSQGVGRFARRYQRRIGMQASTAGPS